MKAVRITARSVAITFALTTIAAYGLLLPLTGFYWDDWPFAWIAQFQGPAEFIPAFGGFRPFLGPIFYLTTSLLPPIPLLWQLFALLIRFLAALAAWFALDQIWPRARRFTFTAALLFLVFPGYSQHWVALTHINQEWISLIAYLLSFGLGIRAARGQRVVVTTAGAILLQCVALFPTEYFLGLELLRPLFFWAALSAYTDASGPRLRAVLKAWAPHLLLWLINAAWLLYYYQSGAYISYDLTSVAGGALPSNVLRVLVDAIWKAGLYAWFQVIPLVAGSVKSPTSIGTIILIGIAFSSLAFFLLRLDAPSSVPESGGGLISKQGNGGSPEVSIARLAVLIGIVGVFVGRMPSFAAGLPLTLQSSFDRLTISMMLGASLFAAGIVTWLVRRFRARACAVAGLAALAIGQQFFNANIFRRDWQRQQEIYWQLAWRIPALKPHTAILTQQMPLDYETDLAMTAVINWIYAPNPEPPDLPYAVVYTEKRLGGDVLPALQKGRSMWLPLRTMQFSGSTSQVVAVYVPPGGCLRVFDPANDDQETYSRFPEALTATIPLSDPSRILPLAASVDLPSPPFIPEPAHSWCYFYERAELSRQVHNWTDIVMLRAQAADEGHAPTDPFEWLPFIEAEARAGDVGWAQQTTRKALQDDPRLERGLCALWRRVDVLDSNASQIVGANMQVELNCSAK